MKLTFNRVWLAYNIIMTFALLACAAFLATSDGWVRLDGWLAIGTGLAAVMQWHDVEKENRRARYGW